MLNVERLGLNEFNALNYFDLSYPHSGNPPYPDLT